MICLSGPLIVAVSPLARLAATARDGPYTDSPMLPAQLDQDAPRKPQALALGSRDAGGVAANPRQ